jgi:subtilisin family serine protease
MRFRPTLRILAAGAIVVLAACSDRPTSPTGDAELARQAAESKKMTGINVLTSTAPTAAMLRDLGAFGPVFDVMPEINAVIMAGKADRLEAIRALPFVRSAELDGEVTLDDPAPTALASFVAGFSMWNLDAINVTSGPGAAKRSVAETGKGVYIGVIDTGLLPTWRSYFHADRIASEYATSFVGGGALSGGATPSPTGFWENDQNTHGTHVTSTILGFSFSGTPITGVAPEATVIPVKVLNQNGRGWWSAIAQGVVHITRLKQNELAAHPMVINMSLGSGPGGSTPLLLKEAIDNAIKEGVIVVAAAGNNGEPGMGAPGSYAPVISVAAIGWNRQFATASWWNGLDVLDLEAGEENDRIEAAQYFIAPFSSRQRGMQDLDVSAPGVAVVGPAQTDAAHLLYQYFNGTSMASPHVAGAVALMAQKKPSLTAAEAESILEKSALPMTDAVAPNCPMVSFGGPAAPICWGKNATGHGILQVDKALAKIE